MDGPSFFLGVLFGAVGVAIILSSVIPNLYANAVKRSQIKYRLKEADIDLKIERMRLEAKKINAELEKL